MDTPVLTDKSRFPTEEVIFSHIGKSRTLWISLFEAIHTDHPDFTEQWRYYNDGKSWLLKVTRKSKTIFWLSILPGTFRTTFYFGDKARQAIAASPISDELKEQYTGGKKFGTIRGVTITYKHKNDVAYAKALMAVKLSIK